MRFCWQPLKPRMPGSWICTRCITTLSFSRFAMSADVKTLQTAMLSHIDGLAVTLEVRSALAGELLVLFERYPFNVAKIDGDKWAGIAYCETGKITIDPMMRNILPLDYQNWPDLTTEYHERRPRNLGQMDK